MFKSSKSYHLLSKRQKLSEQNNFISLSNTYNHKKDFLLEIKANSEDNINKDSSLHSWIKYDLSKTNKSIDLSGAYWSFGISGCIINNSINSWKINTKDKTDLPSSSFIKIAVKYLDKPTELLGIKFLENRLYSKQKIISQINTFLSAVWNKKCHPNFDGINLVGEIFSLILFTFYLDKIDNTIHILSLTNISSNSISSEKSWQLFQKIYNAFKINEKDVLERIEIYISKELNKYLGEFEIPSKIINFKSDQDLTKYDEDSSALDIRCGLIPCSIDTKESTSDIKAKNTTPTIKPSSISIYTNIPISNKGNEKIINGKIYQLLHQIPIKNFNENSPSSIQYFPQKISYKNITPNYKLNIIEILLVDSDTNSPLNLNNKDFTLNLDFIHKT